jgi:hypothetical protein
MSTAARVIDDLTAPAVPASTRLRLAAQHLAGGATPLDHPGLLARLAEIINGPGGDERVVHALAAYDAAFSG